jgi:hypothetical protein
MALGKTCRYCSSCEIVMVSRKELEAEIARGLSRVAPEVIGKDYLVLGTIEKRIWQHGLGSPGKTIAEMLKHVADFKHQYDLDYKPGGWHPVTQEPRRE